MKVRLALNSLFSNGGPEFLIFLHLLLSAKIKGVYRHCPAVYGFLKCGFCKISRSGRWFLTIELVPLQEETERLTFCLFDFCHVRVQ